MSAPTEPAPLPEASSSRSPAAASGSTEHNVPPIDASTPAAAPVQESGPSSTPADASPTSPVSASAPTQAPVSAAVEGQQEQQQSQSSTSSPAPATTEGVKKGSGESSISQPTQQTAPDVTMVTTTTATAASPSVPAIASTTSPSSIPQPQSQPLAQAQTPGAPANVGAIGSLSVPSRPPNFVLDDEKKMEMVKNMDATRVAALQKRAKDLHLAGHTKETSSELGKILMVLEMYSRAKQSEQEKQAQAAAAAQNANGRSPSSGPTDGPAASASTAPSAPAPTPAHISMTPAQIAQLRSQAAAYQNLSRGQPVPSYLLSAAQGTPPAGIAGQPPVATPFGGVEAKIADKVVEAVVDDAIEKNGESSTATSPAKVDRVASGSGAAAAKQQEAASVPIPAPPTEPPVPAGPPYAMEFDESSLIYPYNAYTHPSTYAYRKFDDEVTNPLNKMQKLITPSLMPKGLDPYLLMEERNRYIETRMAWRLKELETMPATTGQGEQGAKDVTGITENDDKPTPNLGIQARIELLSLRLLGKQRLLREDVVRAMHGATQVPADRSQFRRFRTHLLRDARATETAERRQRTEREQRGKQRHLAYIASICEHGQNMIGAGVGSSRGSGADKMKRLGKAMMKLHADTEKEEQRRIERLAKERLKALKNDDEDAYLALLGEAKDSRIGHLLKQTDQYLETLAAAVVEQQNDDVHSDQRQFELPFEQEEGPASEELFGARRQDGEEAGAEARAGKVDYYAVAHRIQEKVTKQASILTGGTLKDYQVKGLQWMISLYNNRLNGILADEMGLGKTIQTISLITYLIEAKRQAGPFLVIVPLSTLTNWTLEFERWAPAVRTLILKGSPAVRKEFYPRLRAVDFQVCLTTYEYIIKERPLLSKIKWVHMIIDEGHRMKNVKSKLSQTLNEYYITRHRLILTGTPLQNNLPELWALLNFVLPKIFNSVKSFDEWFNAPFANTGGEKMEMNEEEALLVVKRLHKVLRPFLLRRLKKDVESELPDKVEKVIYTKMSALQWKLYESVQKYKTLPTDMSVAKPQKRQNLQNALMQLRKICNHPYVFREVDEDFTVGNTTDEQIIRVAGKFELLDRILPKLFKTGHKVLIFFQMTEIMTIVSDFFEYRGWKYCRLDGSTKAEDRQALLSTFNDPQSPYQVFILSTRAGGLGLNLQSADTVIIYDTDWNPHADLQAQDRAHRIGQKKEVRVLRLISSGTVEELVLARAQQKLAIDGKVIQAGKFDDVTTGAEYEALLAKAFETNPEDDNEETNELDDDELNELLARGDHELEIFAQMDKERQQAKIENWKASGKQGELPPVLMQESELPPFYRRDIGQEMALQVANEEEQGRGRRAKAEVRYTDGLTDDQFIAALENSDDDVEEAADRKRARAEKKAERKRMNEILARAEAEGKPLDSASVVAASTCAAAVAVPDESGTASPPPSTPIPGMKKKRGRPSTKSATPSVMGDEGVPSKRRKLGGPSAAPISGPELAFMNKMFAETNKLKSDLGEDLNQFFLTPVSKRDYPDYYVIIAQPIAMSQIRTKIGKPGYTVHNFKSDMHLLWDNARTYNQEGSWVFNAAEDMQEFFDKLWEEEYPKLPISDSGNNALINGNGTSNGGTESAEASGSSTPMFKANPPERVTAPKIRISMGKKKMQAKIEDDDDDDENEDGSFGAGGGGAGDDDDEDMDDDY
ncbi:ATP-dependent helicase STH1/SNF2 [Kwoniella heveanensis BCC8398]|uniref:ATP-dependent helicase STH1/SNF2 n=1 Tax=Kwoniella heveanensis BCC8398 TaxID=1296120 RepID=A0A1B9GVC7_9TREE|nr:ATP-dependent helicase STH1/SNF2 [Kwoniella heveanensis BCC8398]